MGELRRERSHQLGIGEDVEMEGWRGPRGYPDPLRSTWRDQPWWIIPRERRADGEISETPRGVDDIPD